MEGSAPATTPMAPLLAGPRCPSHCFSAPTVTCTGHATNKAGRRRKLPPHTLCLRDLQKHGSQRLRQGSPTQGRPSTSSFHERPPHRASRQLGLWASLGWRYPRSKHSPTTLHQPGDPGEEAPMRKRGRGARSLRAATAAWGYGTLAVPLAWTKLCFECKTHGFST